MCGTASFVRRNADVTLNRNAASNARSLVSISARGSQPPALFTRMSMRPISPTVRSTSRSRSAVTVTSVGTARARRPALADLGRDRFDVGLGARRAHDVGARFGEGPGATGADALARAGDDRDAPVEPESIEDHRVDPNVSACAVSDVVRGDDGVKRCAWGRSTPEYVAYHDNEWGRPVVDDTRLYEKLCLEGFQSGLSWLTILRKREHFRTRLRRVRPATRSRASAPRDVDRLLKDAGIVRHRGKIEAAIANARAVVAVEEQHGSLAALCWSFEPAGAGRRKALADLAAKTDGVDRALEGAPPARIPLSSARRRCYATMQSTGIVNDHLVGCAARAPCEEARRKPQPASAFSISVTRFVVVRARSSARSGR